MGKEQDLLQAVKSADLQTTHKLLSKLKTNRSSEYTPTHWRLRPSPHRSPCICPISIVSRKIKAALRKTSFLVGGATPAERFPVDLGGVPTETCWGSAEPQGSVLSDVPGSAPPI